MKVLVESYVQGKLFVCMFSMPDWAELRDLADTLDMETTSYLERQVYLNLMHRGFGQSLFVRNVETEDQELLEYLSETGNYTVYEGEIHEL